jgi:hypothetical protein
MLLAGALVPYREMNHGLFQDTKDIRERGGVPVPAAIMPLRYAYEAMIVSQAVRNPFEVERIRLQRRIDSVRHRETPLDDAGADRFELAKEGLRRLLAAGADDKKDAAALVSRIRRIASYGTRIEVETMKIWPEENPDARPASEFFVNERIDLMVREAETFRNDYRNKERRIVFHALKKPLPWAADAAPASPVFVEPSDEVDTQRYCGAILLLIILGCGAASTFIVSRQNRQTH